LAQYAVNLNQRAAEGRIDPLIGRHEELARVVQTLCRRRKNNPLLVGEAGVGKTAIAEGLARRIVDDEVPELLSEAVVYSLDLGGLLKELENQPWAILFIDEIHTIIGAGSASGGVMDASNLLKPALADGKLRCVGSTTYSEYRGIFEKDHALARRFQKIDVTEPSVADTVQILEGLKSRYEEHHKVRYSHAALESAAELSARHINDRQLPDKAIDVMDEVGAAMRLRPGHKKRKTVQARDIEEIVARIARIPPRSVSVDDKAALRTLDRDLKLQIYGQDEAIGMLAAAIKLSRSGLGNPERPIANFLFAGPTGVGKTEVTRQLASLLGIELIRFDMSEYMERHTASRLIGAPPGYVGYDQGGLLTDAVDQNPHVVLLLDEIEKAHPEIFNLLLQVMDHGSLTDNNGRKADFRNVILIMTTNAGAADMDRSSIGFTRQDHSGDAMGAIKRLFTPEFRNRLDAIVPFAPLSHEVVRAIVDKLLLQLEVTLEAKKVQVDIELAARDWLAREGYDPALGARPMARLIQERIKRPLADELLFGKLSQGGRVRIGLQDDDLEIDIEAAELSTA
ncbi:MAG: AAA family ATPase, partial [Oceanococcaceae bacterium]